MPTIDIPLTAVAVVQPKATTRFGTPASVNVNQVSQMLLQGSVAGVPAGAVVQSGLILLRSRNNPTFSGSQTVKLTRNTSRFTTATTWATRPTFNYDYQSQQTQTSAPLGATWTFDSTALVQAWVSGVVDNFGVVVFRTEALTAQFQGSSASWGAPLLRVTYAVEAAAPTNLRPQGAAVSLAKPTLTADVGSGTSAIQVQVDASANAASPAFDSGQVAATAGLLDLSTTSYPGLADGATTQHRWRAKNALGWSAWTPWASFSRVAWKAGSVTSPGATSEDPSPTLQATYGGVVTSWRALLRNAAGTVVQDSGWTPGADLSYGTTKSVGASGRADFQIRDNTNRESTPGDPDYLTVSRSFTVAASGTPAPVTGVAASMESYASPVVRVTGSRSEIPDEVVLYRNGTLVSRVPGGDVFTGTALNMPDFTAPMNSPATYTLRVVRNGQFSAESAPITITPTCQGIWVLDPTTGDAVAIWGDDDAEQTQPELAAISRPIGGTGAVVRRRLARAPREGSCSGLLLYNPLGVDGLAHEAALRRWCDPDTGYDAGHIFRLVLGNLNDPVIVGDLEFSEDKRSDQDQRVTGVAFSWWWQG